MITISLCMIVKNEEENIQKSIKCVEGIVDEIIIVDTGSTDNTKEIAKDNNAKVYDFTWTNDFSEARNFSFSKATMDYIIWLDADDYISLEEQYRIKALKEKMDKTIDVVMMLYNVTHDEQGNVTHSFYRERIVKRSKNYKWYGCVHEYLMFSGIILHTNIGVSHDKHRNKIDKTRNLCIYQKMIAEGKKLCARDTFYYARELFFNEKYNEAVYYYDKFLEMDHKHLSYCLHTCIDLSKYYCMQNDSKQALKALFKYFEFDIPRAEICSHIGALYKELGEYKNAIYWCEKALIQASPRIIWGSVLHDFCGFIPCMDLCYCYFEENDIEKAEKYNDMAGVFKPNSPEVRKNKDYINKIKEQISNLVKSG